MVDDQISTLIVFSLELIANNFLFVLGSLHDFKDFISLFYVNLIESMFARSKFVHDLDILTF